MSGAVFLCKRGADPFGPHGTPSSRCSLLSFPRTVPELHLLPGIAARLISREKLIALLCLACAAVAQAPRIGDINYYGLRKVTAEKIQAATGLKKGGTLTASKGDIEDQIDKISGVVLVRVEALCCEARR